MLRKWKNDERGQLLTGAAAENAIRAISDIAEALASSSTPAADHRVPDVRVPDVRVPDVRAAGLRAAGIRAGSARAAGVRAAGVRTPCARATGVRAAGVRAAGARTPGVRAAGVRAAGVRAAGVRAAGVRTPCARAPGFRAPGPSFAGGHAGIALFYAYLAVAWEGPQAARQAWSSLERAVEELSQGQGSGAGFFTGMSGIAWTCHHLRGLLAGETSAEATAEVDAALLEVVDQRPWCWEYDLIYGLAGIGCYALDHPDRRLAAALLDSILARLEELAVVTPDGVTWLTPAHFLPPAAVTNYPAGWYNLGVAHGVPGVIGLLARMAEAGFGGDRARRLLTQAVRWLLAQQRILDGGSRFPTHLSPVGTGPSSRSAWCYGDPGVAAVLWRAARAAGRPTWTEHALTLAQRDIRRPRSQTGVVDAGLCHGATGLGHLYHRLYQATGELGFAAAARGWFLHALAQRQPGRGIAGFASYWPQQHEWHGDPGLLDGVAGIGLALLAAVTPVAPDWDRPLLLALP